MRVLWTRLQGTSVDGVGEFVLSWGKESMLLAVVSGCRGVIDLRSSGCVLFDFLAGEDQNSRMALQGLR